MKLIKRNGAEVVFDAGKIYAAVEKANAAVVEQERIPAAQIKKLTDRVTKKCEKLSRAVSVEEVQDMVERELMALGAFTLAKTYITYRYTRELVRRANTTDDKIMSLIECNNEEVKQENSNKNPTVNSVQRDYMAGEVSKDLTRRLLLPADIVKAHEEGLIHFHDADYFAIGIIAGFFIKFMIPNLQPWAYTLIRLGILPLLMGLGYEVIRLAGKHDNVATRIMSAPGIWAQRLTTKEPTEDMLEIAITSLKCALRDEFPEFKEFYESRGWEKKETAEEESSEAADEPEAEPAKNPDLVEEIFEDIDPVPAFDSTPKEEEI